MRPDSKLWLAPLALSLTDTLNSPARAQCGYDGTAPCHTFDDPAVPSLNSVLPYDFVEYYGYLLPGGADVFAFEVTSPGGLYLNFLFGSSTMQTAADMTLYDSARRPIYSAGPDVADRPYGYDDPYQAAAGLYYVRLTPEADVPITYVRALVFPQGSDLPQAPVELPNAAVLGLPVLPAAVPEPCPLALLGLGALGVGVLGRRYSARNNVRPRNTRSAPRRPNIT